jgi:endo-1,4-beta-xylanase
MSSKSSLIIGALALATTGLFPSCKKQDAINILNTGPYTDTTTSGPLKNAAAADGVLFGLESDYPAAVNNPTYLGIIAKEANISPFGYEMKHGAIVQNNGTFNYTTTDAQFAAITGAGVTVFGHTLNWYQNNNANYLNSIVGGGSSGTSVPNLIANPGFETLGGGLFSNWTILNNSNGTFSAGTGAANVHGGTHSLQAVTVAGGNNYNTQILSDAVPVTAGKKYTISYYIRSATAGSIQFELRNNDGANTVSYQGGQPSSTGFSQISFTYTALNTTLAIAFDLGGNANTFWIDDVSIVDQAAAAAAAAAAGAGAIAGRLDSVEHLWISSIVGHYAGKVKAWDVVNEPMADGSSGVRTNSNTTIPSPAPADWFFWSQYLGRDYAVNAFKYAKAADPAALLFINDYNLESNTPKLDSLIAYVKEIQALGAPIDGIGTEMHIAWNSSYVGIDQMFQALAATGLKVKISEMDVKLNPTSKTGWSQTLPDPVLLGAQADMYHYVISSYLKYVPTAQRYAITVWGVDDPHSWLNTPTSVVDAPLLWDGKWGKKLAYAGVLQALNGK